MILDSDYILERIEAASEEAVREAAAEAAELFRKHTYPNRRRTRAAVFYEVDGKTAVVGLRFNQRYVTSQNTFTHQHFRDVWKHDVRPRVRTSIQRRLNQSLSDTLKG